MTTDRYLKQTLFRHLGTEGQEKLSRSTVAIVGAGGLGSVSAGELVRAGIGGVRLIDRDVVELGNLHRQVLYDESDAAMALPKAFVAAQRLRAANSEVKIEPFFESLDPGNVDRLLGGADLIVDATDNLDARYLINEYCVEYNIPWVYGGAVASEGMTASFVPGGPCFACFSGHTDASGHTKSRTCSTAGVLNTLTALVASLQVTEALKIMIGSDARRQEALFIDLWENEFVSIPMEKNPKCPVCGRHHYTYLKRDSSGTISPEDHEYSFRTRR